MKEVDIDAIKEVRMKIIGNKNTCRLACNS